MESTNGTRFENQFSTNGGLTWSNLGESESYGIDPSVGFDNYGNALYTFLATGVIMLRTTNLGLNWDDPILIGSLSGIDDKPYMAIDNTGGQYDGNIYVSWVHVVFAGLGYEVAFRRSTDHGTSFDSLRLLDQVSSSGGIPVRFMPDEQDQEALPFVQAPMPAVGPNGELYVVWMHVNSFATEDAYYKLVKSTDGGENFTQMESSPPFTWYRKEIGGLDIANIPSLAVDPVTGYVYLVHMDSSDNSDMRVKFLRSRDGGESWEGPTTLGGFQSGWQFFPWVSCDKTGRVSIAFMHCPNPPAETTPIVYSYVIESYDRGDNFTPPVQVSSQGSDPNNEQARHHYMGAAAQIGGRANILWADYRSGTSADPYFSPANTVLYWADANKSTTPYATRFNNARHLLKGGGRIHEVFTSLEEIIYRSGEAIDRLDSTVMLSPENAGNSHPCISGGAEGSVHVVWQREAEPGVYEIWHTRSTDNGATWDAATTLPNTDEVGVSEYQTDGAMPVIGYGLDGLLVVVFCSNEGLRYRLSDDNGSSWQTPNNDVIPGSYDEYVQSPSLAVGQEIATLVYAYAGVEAGVWSRVFDGEGWSEETYVADGLGTSFESHPSVSLDEDGYPVAAWSFPTAYSVHSLMFRRGEADNSWGDWFVELGDGSQLVDFLNPSVTYYNHSAAGTYGVAIANHTSHNNVKLIRYDPEEEPEWSIETSSTSGKWASLSVEDETSGEPVYVWTDQTGTPSEVVGGADYFARVAAQRIERKRRAVVQRISTGATIALEASPVRVVTTQSDTVTLPFRQRGIRDSVQLALGNLPDYLGTGIVDLPHNAEWLLWDRSFRIPNNIPRRFQLHLTDRNGESLAVLDKTVVSGRVLLDVAAFAGMSVRLRPTLTFPGISSTSLKVHVGDVVLFHESEMAKSATKPGNMPTTFALHQNYPNPFNPRTSIVFELGAHSHVKLAVYDLLGREVAVLVDTDRPAGSYTATWDGRTSEGSPVTSGVYFYRLETASGLSSFTSIKKSVLLR